MQIYDTIAAAQQGRLIDNLAQVFRIETEQAEAAVRTALPELINGLERNTLSRGGLADVIGALGHGHHEQMLEDPRQLFTQQAIEDGNQVLGHILGSKDRSRGVALKAAQASGLGEDLIKMLLPLIAQMLMGALSKATQGGLGDILSRLPGGSGGTGGGMPFPMPQPERGGDRRGSGFELPRTEVPQQQGGYPMPPIPDIGGDSGRGSGPHSMPQTAPRESGNFPWPGGGRGRQDSGFPLPLPQAGGSAGRGRGFELPQTETPPAGGYPMPPIPGGNDSGHTTGFPFPMPQGGEQGGGFPFPMPQGGNPGGAPLPLPIPRTGADNPYGDLTDILRKGAGGAVGGGMLWTIVRNILGSVLGFQSRGVMGWLFRLIFMRFGWSILKRMLGMR